MKVRDVMDMTGAVRFREVYTDPTTEIFGYSWSSGLLPRPPGYQGPTNVYDFLKTLKQGRRTWRRFCVPHRAFGGAGLDLSRATGKHWAELMSDNIWQSWALKRTPM